MHWIQTIREFLELSREDLARYLQLSTHTIASVETNRRRLPMDSLLPAITLYNVIRDCNQQTPLPSTPLKEELRHLYHQKSIYSECCRRIDKCTRELEKIQGALGSGRLRLDAYQSLARALAADNKSDRARLQWAQWKMQEAMQAIHDNNVTAHQQLASDIAGMKSMMHALEESSRTGYTKT